MKYLKRKRNEHNACQCTTTAHQYRCEHFAATRKCLCRNVKRAMYWYSWEPVSLLSLSLSLCHSISRSARPISLRALIWHLASRCRHSGSLVYVCHATHAQTASCRSVLIRLCVSLVSATFVCLRRCLAALCIVCLGSWAYHTQFFPLAQHMHMQSHHRKVIWCGVESTGAIRKRADTDERILIACVRVSLLVRCEWVCVCVKMRNQRESKYYSNKVCCTSAPSCCCCSPYFFFLLRCRRLVSRFVSLERQLIDVDDYTMAMRAREFTYAMKRLREWKKNIMMKNV